MNLSIINKKLTEMERRQLIIDIHLFGNNGDDKPLKLSDNELIQLRNKAYRNYQEYIRIENEL